MQGKDLIYVITFFFRRGMQAAAAALTMLLMGIWLTRVFEREGAPWKMKKRN